MKTISNIPKREYYIDLIRVIAVISVLVCHYTRGLESAGIVYSSMILPNTVFDVYLGSYGVTLFFIVSGASLMLVYGNCMTIKDYFKKRFLGIYPMFWIAYIIGFLTLFTINRTIDHSIPKSRILLSVFGMDGYLNWFGANFYVLGEWFLGCIILLYLCFPLLRKCILKAPVLSAIAIMIIYVVVSIFFSSRMPKECLFILRIPEFAFGMYYVRYMKQTHSILAIIAAGVLVFCGIVDLSYIQPIYVTPVVGIASFFVLSYLAKFIDFYYIRKACSIIGKYSYAIFLTHHVIIRIFLKRFSGETITRLENYLIFLIFLILLAIISFNLYKINGKIMYGCKEILARIKYKQEML